jgi:hypothetical protein
VDEETKKHLTCAMCKETKETYSEIVYSQGSRVCLDCKKITQVSDNAAFDRDMRLR